MSQGDIMTKLGRKLATPLQPHQISQSIEIKTLFQIDGNCFNSKEKGAVPLARRRNSNI